MRTGQFRIAVLGAVSLAAMTCAAAPAMAGAFGIREQSVVGAGEAFAGAASGAAGLGSLFWNPATITMNPGWQSEINGTYISPSARITPLAPSPTRGLGPSGEIGYDGAIPASYTTYQVNDKIWLGIANSAPFGLITKPNYTWAGQTYSRSSRVFSANFNPIIGLKVTDWFSIGVGPTVQYFKTRLKQAVGVTPTSPSAILDGDDVSAGFTVGATYIPIQGTTIGVGYRSSIEHELKGYLRSYVPAGPAIGTPLYFPATVKLNLPDQVNVGVSQVVTDTTRVNFGFEYTNWSRLKTPAVLSQAGFPLTVVPLGYKDGFYYSVGGEWDYNPQWTFRLGFAYEVSPIDDTNRGTRVPDTDRYHVNAGATYKYSEMLELSAYYSHIFTDKSRITLQPGNVVYNALPLFADVKASVDLVGVSAKIRWDNPTYAQPAAVIRSR